ncbi:deaminated glutathione amidase [Bartonella sp. LJL80]
MMKVAVGQFAVAKDYATNLATITRLVAKAEGEGANFLALPECILARDASDPHYTVKTAQPEDGPFVSGLLDISVKNSVALSLTFNMQTDGDKVLNRHLFIHQGKIIAHYDKLHLYDAFAVKESNNVVPGERVPPIVEFGGFRLGLMTCYDIRFPELARRLVVDGADILLLPAAWLKGPGKESHWEILLRARALENTSYLIASGECGERNIGMSMVVDPLGIIMAQGNAGEGLFTTTVDRQRLQDVRAALPCLQNRRFIRPELGKGQDLSI